MKIINRVTGEVIATIITNHSMCLDEAIRLVGDFVPDAELFEENVVIDGESYYYDDLDMDWEA